MKLIISLLVTILFVACSDYDLKSEAEKRYCKQTQYVEVLQYKKICDNSNYQKHYCLNRAITSICDSVIPVK